MYRLIAYTSACVGLVILLIAAVGYLGLGNLSNVPMTAINDNFVLRALSMQYIQTSAANIDAADLYRWLWNRVLAIAAIGTLILCVAVAGIVRQPRMQTRHDSSE